MERIKRALELASREREHLPPTFIEARLADVQPPAVVESPEPPLVDLKAWRTPVVPSDAAHRERERLLTVECAGPVGAAYKMLRTQILRKLEQLGANSLAVISAAENDGKTVTAINLAISIAADPARTALLVDFDLRNPNVHRKLGMEVRSGVEACLRRQSPVEAALVRPEGFERLTVLPALERVEYSSELLGGAAAGEIVRELKSRYANRIVLFDLPPVLQSDDALAFSRHVDAALLVVGEGRTARDDLTRTLALLKDTPIVGTVLNASREETGRYY